jgi:hypothetical protein
VVLGDDELLLSSANWAQPRAVKRGALNSFNTYRMALAKRTNVKEGKGLVALEKLEGWDFSCRPVSTGYFLPVKDMSVKYP